MEDEAKSTWTCPGCFEVFRHCGRHATHQADNPSCMKATMNPARKSGQCFCNEDGPCACGYRERPR